MVLELSADEYIEKLEAEVFVYLQRISHLEAELRKIAEKGYSSAECGQIARKALEGK